jgi:hypothetical protein
MEQSIKYVLKEQDFDDVMDSVVEDFLLPGMGVAWPRYVPTIKIDPATRQETVVAETVAIDYVFWKDFRTNKARRWSEVWWVARRSYMTRDEVKARFGSKVAGGMSFKNRQSSGVMSDEAVPDDQAPVWEIWNKREKTVIWYSENYGTDILDKKPDILGLKDFFPCPRPVRAISTNDTFIPRPFYSQYQAQADELNDITSRIRRLVDALRVVGVYDSSQAELKNLLTGTTNKMVPVEGWATMQEKGGLKGTVDFLSIQEIANALMQLYDARERVKGEIYEITGWSDIVRGVSKASETLGAQRIKADWAGSRLKKLQKEIQRFVRDLLRITGEIIAEHFSMETLVLISGVEVEMQDPQKQAEQVAMFTRVYEKFKSDKDRCALITIETDSTLLPDETQDKQSRMEFLGAAGAYLQQAVPAIQTEPRLAPLLGEILMFAVRSFRAARPLEDAFKQFSRSIQQQGTIPPQGKDGKGAQGQPDKGPEMQLKAQIEQGKASVAQGAQALQREEMQQDAAIDKAKLDLAMQQERNRHDEKMRELALREREVAVKEAELGIKRDQAASEEAIAVENMNREDAHRQEDRLEARQDKAEDQAFERESRQNENDD